MFYLPLLFLFVFLSPYTPFSTLYCPISFFSPHHSVIQLLFYFGGNWKFNVLFYFISLLSLPYVFRSYLPPLPHFFLYSPALPYCGDRLLLQRCEQSSHPRLSKQKQKITPMTEQHAVTPYSDLVKQ